MIKTNQKGQSLVEALIALGVATIVVSAMAIAAITAVNNADFSKYQNLATNYAQQEMEIIRQHSQTDWHNLILAKLGSSKCLDINQTETPLPCSKNIDNFFGREVTLTQTSSGDSDCHGTVHAVVTVSWADGKCSSGSSCHNVTLDSCFADIN